MDLTFLKKLKKKKKIMQERIVKADNAIESIVRSLGRRVGERKLAVALLLELSKYYLARDCIGKVQGCILLLVTMSSSDDSQAARDAQELLENLSFSDQNVIQMAKANYFRHLLHRLSTGYFYFQLNFVSCLFVMSHPYSSQDTRIDQLRTLDPLHFHLAFPLFEEPSIIGIS